MKEYPKCTHEGIMEIGDQKIRVYRLEDGRAIIDAEDLHKFFGVNSLQELMDELEDLNWPSNSKEKK